MKIIHMMLKGVFILMILLISACKDFVEIDAPQDQTLDEKVYANNETAIAAVRGIYAQMMTGSGFASGGSNGITFMAGRSADDFINYNSNDNLIQFSVNNLLPDNTSLRSGLWQEPFKYIYYANLILENLDRSLAISAEIKQQLQGEAKFIRAFCNFYLTNLFGDIPVILTTDYRINAGAFANTTEEIYQQIIEDLKQSKEQLGETYPSDDRIRPIKWAASALLARVYLYNKDWANAEAEASAVIANDDLYKLLDNLDEVFLKNSKETILQFALPPNYGINTNEGSFFILNTPPTSTTQILLSDDLLQSFESDDLRLEKWVGSYTSGTATWKYPFKYKIKTGGMPFTEYSMVLRIAEQFLIRAEARAMQNDLNGAACDLNKIRLRADLTEISFDFQPEVLKAIEKERRSELFAEWGHRWLDLKRNNRAALILKPLKGTDWQNTDVLYPIPKTEIDKNPNLKQNEGYK